MFPSFEGLLSELLASLLRYRPLGCVKDALENEQPMEGLSSFKGKPPIGFGEKGLL